MAPALHRHHSHSSDEPIPKHLKYEGPCHPTRDMPKTMLSALLLTTRRKQPHALALLTPVGDDTVEWTFNDVSEQVEAISGWLRQRIDGKRPRHLPGKVVVGLLLETGVPYVLAVLSCLHAGVVFMPLDPSWAPETLHAAAQRCTLVLFADQRKQGCGLDTVTAPAVQLPESFLKPPSRDGNAAACPNGSAPLGSGFRAAWEQNGVVSHEQSCAQESNGISQESNGSGHVAASSNGHVDDTIYVMCTSGSTGGSKAVCGTATGILNRCWWMDDSYPFCEGDVCCFHTATTFVDSIWQMLGPLLGGIPCLVLPPEISRNPMTLVQALIRRSVTHFVAVPRLLRNLLPVMERLSSRDKLAMRVLVSSGEPLQEQLLWQLQDALPVKAIILNIYGSTEVSADATCFCVSSQPRRGVEAPAREKAVLGKAGAARNVPVGMPIHNTAVFLLPWSEIGEQVSREWSPCDDREVQFAGRGDLGEVCIAGACVSGGYLGSMAEDWRFGHVPEEVLVANQERVIWGLGCSSTKNGLSTVWPFFRTGDLGRLSANGLELQGRMDEKVKISGVWVSIDEVENCLNRHPAVHTAAAAHSEGPAGYRLHAFVELRDHASTAPHEQTAQELTQWCREHLSPAAVPSDIAVVTELPRSSAGKLQRSQLRALIPARQVADGAAAAVPASLKAEQ